MPTLEITSERMKLSIPLALEETQVDQFKSQLARLAERDVELSDRAKAFMLLAIEAIAAEPSRDWPAFLRESPDDKRALQQDFIDGLGSNFLPFGYELQRRRNDRKIDIFDAIQRTSELSVTCPCVRTPPTVL